MFTEKQITLGHTKILLIPATAKDAGTIIQIIDTAIEDKVPVQRGYTTDRYSMPVDDYTEMLRNSHIMSILARFADNKAGYVGFVSWYHKGKDGTILDLFTTNMAPKGMGTTLLKTAEGMLKNTGCNFISLVPFPDSRGFYTKNSYRYNRMNETMFKGL